MVGLDLLWKFVQSADAAESSSSSSKIIKSSTINIRKTAREALQIFLVII